MICFKAYINLNVLLQSWLKLFSRFFCTKVFITITITLTILSHLSFAQYNRQWDKTFGGSALDNAYTVVQTSDGGYAVFGYTQSPNSATDDITPSSLGGTSDYWMVKTDATGVKLWDYRYGGTGSDIGNRVIGTSDGGLLIGGNSNSPVGATKTAATNGLEDYWIVKTDASGIRVWDNSYGGSNEDQLSAIIRTADGGYLIGGRSLSGISGTKTENNWDVTLATYDIWLVKIDVNGAVQWDKTLGGSGTEELGSIIQLSDGSYIIGGNSQSSISGDKTENSRGSVDYWIVKLDATGVKQWDRTYGGSSEERLKLVLPASTGDFFLLGFSDSGVNGDKTSANNGGRDYWVVKIDANGNKLSDHSYGGSNEDNLQSAQITPEGGLVMVGASSSPISGDKTQASYGSRDFWIVKTDGVGNKILDKILGSAGDDNNQSIIQTADGGYMMVGVSTGGISNDKSEVSRGGNDFWMIKTDDGVNDLPVTTNDVSTTLEEASTTGNVLTNDSDPENGLLTANTTLVTAAANGSVVIAANGSYTYTPNVNFTGTDSFVYRVCDNGLPSACSDGTVTITVNPVNDAPVFTSGSNQSVVQNTGAFSLTNWATGIGDGDTEFVQTVTFTVTNNNNSLFSVQPAVSATGTLTFTPAPHTVGTATVSIYLQDNGSGTAPDVNTGATQTFTITVTTPPPPSGCSGLDPGGNPASGGLYAEYYNGYFEDNQSFFTSSTPATRRIDAPLDFNNNFGFTSFENFSARYRGSIQILTPGVYTFYLTSDDASFMWIDNLALNSPAQTNNAFIDNGTRHSDRVKQTSLYLNAGYHNVLIHYGNGVTNRTLKLEYAGPSITRQVIPANRFCSTVQPAASGVPVSISYSPAKLFAIVGNSGSSVAPTINNNGGSPITQYVISNIADLPTGISINSSGVISVDGSVPVGNYNINVAATNANGTTIFYKIYTLNIAPAPAAFCSGVDYEGNAAAGGYYAEFYNGNFADNHTFFDGRTPDLTRIEPRLNYSNNFNLNSPTLSGLNPTNFSARMRSKLNITTPGTYTFYFSSDDAGYFWLDKPAFDIPVLSATALIKHPGNHPAQTGQATVTLTAGIHHILIHYGQGSADAVLRLEYEGPGVARQIISNNVLCTSVPLRPIVAGEAYSTDEDIQIAPSSTDLLSNDITREGRALTTELVTSPTHGTLTLNANGTFNYTPTLNYFGNDSFTYRISDGILTSSANATVNITINPVNDPPVAANDAIVTIEDSPATVNVITNDSDVDGTINISSLTITANPSQGNLVVNTSTGAITYTPLPNTNGNDSFSYTIIDNVGAISNVGVVSVTINPMNDAPVAVNDSYSAFEDTQLSSTLSLLANDTDVENTTLVATVVTQPANGVLTLNNDGSFSYNPALNFYGNDSFTYQANDGVNNSNIATVSITVSPINDAPVVADDNYSTSEDNELIITAPGIFANDSDVEGDVLTASLVSNTTHGTLRLNSNGTFAYTPDADFFGSDSFTYRLNDGTINSTVFSTVTITVTPVNDAPVAVDDMFFTRESDPLVIDVPGLLSNDTDTEGGPLTVQIDSYPAFGSLTLQADGSFTYTPNIDFQGEDTFTYTLVDEEGATSTATVGIKYIFILLKVSEGFSPNNDGNNDTWFIRGIDSFPNNSIKIFNRWGMIVYEHKNYDNNMGPWDGKANAGTQSGKYLDQGTYYYTLNIGSEFTPLTGMVMIVR